MRGHFQSADGGGGILRKANREVLRAHLEHCVKGAFEAGDAEDEKRKIEEIVQLMSKMM